MKRTLQTWMVLVLPLLLWVAACDKVDYPIVTKNTVTGSKFIERNNASVSNFRKMLLEDYTGARCPNCPDAAVTAKNLLDAYRDTLVVIAVHAGGFAVPFGTGFKNQDFRTEAGDTWNGSAGFNIPSYPNGMVNRRAYVSGQRIIQHNDWGTAAAKARADQFIVKLNVATKYDTAVGALNVDVRAKFVKPYNSAVSISAVLTEDSVVGRQIWGSTEIDDYEFEHMLRGTLNGVWGTTLKSTPSNANDSVSVSYNDFNVKGLVYNIVSPPATKPILVNDRKISVVVFVYDSGTREVLQVEKVKIR